MPSEHSLSERLASALPKHTPLKYYHLSTPPTRSPAIHAAPPGAKPERTYLESQFLNVAIETEEDAELLVFAIEVLIYTTRHLTTVFVSKADSTGYLGLLNLGKGYASPLRTIATTFLGYIVETRRRAGVKLVVSLFARANDQYLFPGSVKNKSKHVSDDRQLVKWWCRVLDPVLRRYNGPDEGARSLPGEVTSQAFLLVPGEDGIAGFLPQDVRLDPILRRRWKHGHPLREITAHPAAPPRCLIPHFPDDPKSRFLDELDDELPDGKVTTSSETQDSPSNRGNGRWKSVRSLEQFWEMMAFRQECSSGRLVGFVWLVFSPPGEEMTQAVQMGEGRELLASLGFPSGTSSILSRQESPLPQKSKRLPRRRRKILKGPIIPRTPRIKKIRVDNSVNANPKETAHYTWPVEGRGNIVLSEKRYQKANEVLLRLDFTSQAMARKSTRTWIEEVSVLAGRDVAWAERITGRKELEDVRNTVVLPSDANRTTLLSVKRKLDIVSEPQPAFELPVNDTKDGHVIMQVKKKSKRSPTELCGVVVPDSVNMLGGGIVRKKPKAS